MANDIDDSIDEIYKISKQYEKAKQLAASLKGRKQEIQKRAEKEWGLATLEELRSKEKSLKKELRIEEEEIEELYKELKKDFADEL